MPMPHAERLAVQYFDGVSARPHEADIWLDGDQLCIQSPDGLDRRVPRRQVQWPERQRHGARVAHLPDGSALHCANATSFDEWAGHQRVSESWVVSLQQSWRWTIAGVLLLAAAGGALYQWGLPWGARTVLAFVPREVDRQLGDVAMRSIQDQGLLMASELPLDQQQRLRAAWAQAVVRAGTPGLDIDLRIHKSRIGPNAFALPGGQVVLTDEMVALTEGREDMLVGVLAHEAGHVKHRHTMRLVAQATLLGTATTVAFGDFSGLLTAVPAVLGHLGYSRDFEREADSESIAMLKANGISPEVMATVFERLRAAQREKGMPALPIALGSHPPEEERIARFRAAAGP